MLAQLVVAGWKTVSLVDDPLQWIDGNMGWLFKAGFMGLVIHALFLGTLAWFGYSYYTAYQYTYIPTIA